MTVNTDVAQHPERKEIARYLLSRGLDSVDLVPRGVRRPKRIRIRTARRHDRSA